MQSVSADGRENPVAAFTTQKAIAPRIMPILKKNIDLLKELDELLSLKRVFQLGESGFNI